MDKFSFLGAIHTNQIESLYEMYLEDSQSVDESWRTFFSGFDFANESYSENDEVPETFKKEFQVINLIDSFRKSGHLFTQTNPVRDRRKYTPTLDIENFGLSEDDLDSVFQAGSQVGIGPSPLRDIVAHLKKVYCQSIGVEYMYIRKPDQVEWIKNRLHQNSNTPSFSIDQKKQILRKLNQAVAFENFLHTKYVGQKRFSLEGAESLIPALDVLIEHGASLGVEEFVVGMAHRGRLNVLANIFNKTYKEIFSEFEGIEYEDKLFSGDVKYHLGFTSEQKCNNEKNVKISLSPNPSHLEAVDPVVEGISRAKIDEQYQGDNNKLVPILIHGDAALAGQGVVYEVIQMAQLDGYKTGGTIHIVINNQIGFTTNYHDARSSTYCTDIGKVTLSPVFHVNGDDVEAVVHAVQMATEYRQKFHKDVFIDLLCYRKYGHNEGDEPRFTQPLLYKAISKHANPREIYNQKLINEGLVEANLAKEMEKEFKQFLQDRFDASKEVEKARITPFLQKEWEGMHLASANAFEQKTDTNVSIDTLKQVGKHLYEIPENDQLFKKTQRILNDQRKMIEETNKIDWGMAELLAYGTLLHEGNPIRLSGQDVERGTFSHRHAVLKLEDTEKEICPLNSVSKTAKFEAYNSLLSEYGVLGFDYGYAMARPHSLTIWEAQFGDFSNGGQIMLDQFISCAEDKWRIQNGLVMLLPHGYEGQGAEHSSARLERYLQMCAQDNMQIANCTTPANFFHVLRRQLKRDFRKPLVVFTPKSLLRHPKCISTLEDLSTGTFQELIDDPTAIADKVEKVAICSGKIYYELETQKLERGQENIAIIRLEQLYPLPVDQIEKILKKYCAKKIMWVQEEPANMGAWSHIMRNFRHIPFEVIARSESAATASGSSKRSFQRQNEIIEQVFK
tara:strand:- start:1459 stop:4164 length:2706 start_codon:yes stop_codon:yes gene_type:complete